MRVLVARPRAQAEATAGRLARLGHQALAVPVLTVVPVRTERPPMRPAALLVTSANAVQAAAEHLGEWRALPVFAAGDRTGAALTRSGFEQVVAADGSGAGLARLVTERLPPGTQLLHLVGHDRKPEPGRALAAAGYPVAVWEVYAAEPAPALPEPIAEALRGARLDAALHYSRRSAETLVALAAAAGLAAELWRLVHLCLSADVAAGLGPPGTAEIAVASAPNEDALLRELEAIARRGLPPAAPSLEALGIGRTPSLPQGGGERVGADGGVRARTLVPAGARAAGESDAMHMANPAPQDPQPPEDGRPPMSDPRRPDPLRREPPVIDMPASAVLVRSEPAESAASPADEAAETAVEPVAATGLGPDPFPEHAQAIAEATEPSPSGEPVATDAVPVVLPEEGHESGPVATSPGDALGEPATPDAAADPAEPSPSDEPAEMAAVPIVSPETGGERGRSGIPPSGARGDDGGRPATPASDPVRTEAPRRTGSLLAASLIGGLVGAAIMAALGSFLLQPNDLSDRVAAIEKRVASVPATPANLDARLAGLEAGVRQATETAAAARTAADGASKQAAAAASRPEAPGVDPAMRDQVAGLAGRVEEGARLIAAGGVALRELGGRVDGLQGRIQDSLTPAVTALQGSLRALGETVGGLRTGSGMLETRSMDLERRLGALSGDVAKLSPQAFQAGLRVVVAGRLDDALRAGSRLEPAIAALRKLGTPAAQVAALAPFAATPPAGAGALAAEFRPLAEQMLAQPPSGGESIAERLRRVAERVVTVRVVGDGSGSDLPGLVARIQGALGRADLAAAAADWDRLPVDAKRLSAPWAERLKARVAAEAAARQIAADALGALDTAMP